MFNKLLEVRMMQNMNMELNLFSFNFREDFLLSKKLIPLDFVFSSQSYRYGIKTMYKKAITTMTFHYYKLLNANETNS